MKKVKQAFEWNRVTPLSKLFAMTLLVLLPIIGIMLGIKYERAKSVDVDNNVVISSSPHYSQQKKVEAVFDYRKEQITLINNGKIVETINSNYSSSDYFAYGISHSQQYISIVTLSDDEKQMILHVYDFNTDSYLASSDNVIKINSLTRHDPIPLCRFYWSPSDDYFYGLIGGGWLGKGDKLGVMVITNQENQAGSSAIIPTRTYLALLSKTGMIQRISTNEEKEGYLDALFFTNEYNQGKFIDSGVFRDWPVRNSH